MQNKFNEIMLRLEPNLKEFNKDFSFSEKPGIYAIGLNSFWEFSLNSTKIKKESKEIIYIGKSENSQISRDVKTHFKSGKSGSSTLRRSLGAILREKLNLIPIPRSCTEKTAKRFTNYKFTDDGEEKLTEWMNKNLSLSYWEWSGSIVDLRRLENEIVEEVCPILNIQNNRNNKWKSEIKKLRKICRDKAEENENLCKEIAK